MAILYFSDVLNKVGLDPRKVKLICHALTDKGFRDCYDKNMILEYTRLQKRGFSKDYNYGTAWSFMRKPGTPSLRVRLTQRSP